MNPIVCLRGVQICIKIISNYMKYVYVCGVVWALLSLTDHTDRGVVHQGSHRWGQTPLE